MARGDYEFVEFERRWQEEWDDAGVNSIADSATDPTYVLPMIPFPSGEIHIGHLRTYAIADAFARFARLRGDSVLFPHGWDSFGVPAETGAANDEVTPFVWIDNNIARMEEEISQLGLSIDRDRTFRTDSPDYYRWTQDIFRRLFEEGLVESRKYMTNWCPSCEVTLPNTHVTDQRCVRCEEEVEYQPRDQWFINISKYAEELHDTLEKQNWPAETKERFESWVRKKHGHMLTIEDDQIGELDVFTDRLDAIHGATFVALAPTHPRALNMIEEYPELQSKLNEGVGDTSDDLLEIDTGLHIEHPLTGEQLPVYIAEYVRWTVGPNARFGVPGHSRQDYRFARSVNLPIKLTVDARDGENANKQNPPVTDQGHLTDAGEYSDRTSEDAITAFESVLNAEGTTEYRLQDWLVSRDRYWGTPIPLVNCDACGTVPVLETDLPVELPIADADTTTQLHDATEWKQTNCPSCGEAAEREPRTLDPLFDSAWYFLRAISPQIATAPFEATQASAWMNVDLYVGTINSTIIHIVYARVLTKALRDMGLLEGVDEPFEKLLSQAIIKSEGEKMSKSRGNVISAVRTIESYGADTVRFYILGTANPGTELSWKPSELDSVHQYLVGVFNFVNRLANDETSYGSSPDASSFMDDEIDATIARTREAYNNQEFQTVVTEIRALVSLLRRYESFVTPNQGTLLRGVRSVLHLLFPIAPHVAEELWDRLNHNNLLATATLADPTLPENYEPSRKLITNIQEDCRNIDNATNSDDTDWIEITLAPEWKYSLVDQVQDAAEGDGMEIATGFAKETDELVGQEGAHQVVANIDWDRVTGLTQNEELSALRSASWLLMDEFETEVRIQTLPDSDREPTESPHPGRPAIHFQLQ